MEPHEDLTNRRAALEHAVRLSTARDGYEKTEEILAEAEKFLAFLNGEKA